MISKLQRAMRLRPYFYHVFFILSMTALITSCGGSEKQGQSTTPETTPSTAKGSDIPHDIKDRLKSNTCLACHKVDERLVGPSFRDIAARKYSNQEMVRLMQYPEPENWPGYSPMISMSSVPENDLLAIAAWINEIPLE